MGFLSSLFGSNKPVKQAQRANEANARRAEEELRGGFGTIESGFADSDARLSQLLDDLLGRIDAGFGRSESLIRGTTRQARRDTIDAGRRTEADLVQGLVSSGRYNSSVADNLRRGVASDVSRNLGALAAGEGQQLAGLAERGTGMAAQAIGTVGGMAAMTPERRLQQELMLRSNLANAIMSVQHVGQPTQGLLGGLAGAGAGIGSLLGAPFGGGTIGGLLGGLLGR